MKLRTLYSWKIIVVIVSLALAAFSWGNAQATKQAVTQAKVEDQEGDIKQILTEVQGMRADIFELHAGGD